MIISKTLFGKMSVCTIPRQDEFLDIMKFILKISYRDRECVACFSNRKRTKKVCHNNNCASYLCFDCLQNILNRALKPGYFIKTGFLKCPLCRQPLVLEQISKVKDSRKIKTIDKAIKKETKYNYLYCYRCKGIVKHSEKSCASSVEEGQLLCETCELKTKNGYKNCPKCKALIEKNGGCNHMICRCGHHFCWNCLKSWKTDAWETDRHLCRS